MSKHNICIVIFIAQLLTPRQESFKRKFQKFTGDSLKHITLIKFKQVLVMILYVHTYKWLL